jgi:hypothetical protein
MTKSRSVDVKSLAPFSLGGGIAMFLDGALILIDRSFGIVLA